MKADLNDLRFLPGDVPCGLYDFVFWEILSTLLGMFIFIYNGNRRGIATHHYTGVI